MLRVDVPENDTHPEFSKLYGGTAIYAINPVDELTARATASAIKAAPINVYNMKEAISKYEATLKELPSHKEKINEPDDEFEEDDPHNGYTPSFR
jgi:hypothetical protein